MQKQDAKLSLSNTIFGIFLVFFSIFFWFMMIKSQIEGNGYVYEDSIAQTIVFLAKGIYQLLIGNVIEGLIYEDRSSSLGLIGLIIFSITILIAIAYVVMCLVLVFGAFTIFPLISAYIIFLDLFYTIKNSFIFNKKDLSPTIRSYLFKKFLNKIIGSIKGFFIWAIGLISGAVIAWGFTFLLLGIIFVIIKIIKYF